MNKIIIGVALAAFYLTMLVGTEAASTNPIGDIIGTVNDGVVSQIVQVLQPLVSGVGITARTLLQVLIQLLQLLLSVGNLV
ncbi:unnamed protein product [Xylocopa violacea]|uniref:Secreted protein n=1 Tax=Xylocopa violacea TaxID=135666 RepID=A0ABP1NX24_XYLVO